MGTGLFHELDQILESPVGLSPQLALFCDLVDRGQLVIPSDGTFRVRKQVLEVNRRVEAVGEGSPHGPFS